ncbi:MAG: hypothetical protein OSB00_15240 [Sphingomonas bacterium]|nr:hypothetical protein [Sphingomonas bacterium]
MTTLLRWASAIALALIPAFASAQTGTSIQFPAGWAPGTSICVKQPDGSCSPVSSANPLPVTGGAGGGSTPTGTAGSPNASVVTVQGINNGTPQNINIAQIGGVAASPNAVQPVSSAQFPAALGLTNQAGSLPVALASDGPIGLRTDAAATTTDATSTSVIAQLKQQVVKQNAVVAALGGVVTSGCAYNSTPPTMANGAAGAVQCTSTGFPLVAIGNSSGGYATVATISSDTNGSAPGLSTNGRNLTWSGSTWARQAGDASGTFSPLSATSNPAVALSPSVSGSAESSRVLKTASGNFYRASITTAGAAGYLMAFDAATVPSDGAVSPRICRAVAANTTLDVAFNIPVSFNSGWVLVFSSTGCFTKTASATAYFEGYYR